MFSMTSSWHHYDAMSSVIVMSMGRDTEEAVVGGDVGGRVPAT